MMNLVAIAIGVAGGLLAVLGTAPLDNLHWAMTVVGVALVLVGLAVWESSSRYTPEGR